MIQNIKFSRINTDVDGQEIRADEGEYRMMENLVPPKKGKGIGFRRESVPGTLEISVSYTGTHKVIGFFEDAPNNRGFYFLWEEAGSPRKDRIIMYDASTKTTTEIVASQYLGWTEDLKIEGISIIDDVLYWSDPIPKFYRIQDQSQFVEINYHVKGNPIATPYNYRFTAIHTDGTQVNIIKPITGPLGDVVTAIGLADLFNNDPSFSSEFTATYITGGTTIKIIANTRIGKWKLTNPIELYFNFYSTNYDPDPRSLDNFQLYPVPPKDVPELTGIVDASIIINKILNRNWQFAIRQTYINNQITVISPYSEVFASAKYPEDVLDNSLPNSILIEVDATNLPFTKIVEILARTPDNGDWFIIKTLNRGDFFSVSSKLLYTFTGTEQHIFIATADAIKQQEGTPRESRDLQLQKNKLFLIDDLTGYDTNEFEFFMNIDVVEESNVNGRRYFKDGGLYNIGTRFFDDDMRTDGTVHRITQVNIPDTGGLQWSGAGDSGKLPARKQYLEIGMTGRPPLWAYQWCFVRSDELRFEQFAQCHVSVHYYVRPQIETDDPVAPTSDWYYMYGNQYMHTFQIDPTPVPEDPLQWRYLHLMLPTNIGIAVKRGMILNFLGDLDTGFPQIATILDVQGPMIVIDRPSGLTANLLSTTELFVEIYEEKNITETSSFYEASEIKGVINPGTSVRAFSASINTLRGDIFTIFNDDVKLNWKYDWDDYSVINALTKHKGLRIDKYTYGHTESYSPSYKPTKIEDVQTESPSGIIGSNYEYDYDFGYINDQSLATRNLGRPAILLQNTREESRPSTLRWSNDYIENATINGLHTFEPLNAYPLPLERGPVNKLQNVGNDIMLAIHSSGVTSLYIGKGIIRSADLNPTLITTEGVIGTDNQLKHSYGTVHASSVSEIDGNAYFWDGVRNEPVRYAQNGLTPLATTFKARVFFKETIPALFGAPDTYDCISEYDRLLNIIWFTFIKGATKLTIGFHESSTSWIGKVGFTPEYFGVVGDQFLGFVNGVPWLHNEDNANHNTFYGVTYKSRVNLDININASFEKAWMGMMVDSNKIWDIPVISNIEGQESNLVANDFIWRDNIYYADFLRDTNTPVEMLSGNQIALRHGKFLSSQVLSIEMELDSTEPHYLNSISVAAELKPGHHVQREKKQ